ncbi:MAG: glycosyltransferase family 4 protein [Verrucomicrobiota bacterium]|nr:glycosyltransferase family 4 protein [Verrucomicrobiota bacterium]
MTEKIILITHEYPPSRGGAGIYCREVATAATKEGFNINVWAPFKPEFDSEIIGSELSWKGSQSWISSIRLFFKIKKHLFQQDNHPIIHIGDLGVCRAFTRFVLFIPSGTRILITIHGSELKKCCSNPIEKILFRRLLQKSERIHVLSKFNQNKCIDFLPSLSSKIKRIGGAPSRVVDAARTTKPIKKDSKELRVLCVGRIHPRKGQCLIVRAACKLPNSYQERLIISFVGPEKNQKYKDQISGFGKNFLGEIEFKGDLNEPDLAHSYRNADIFCLTPENTNNSVEGFGIAYLEASAFSLPILATRVGGVEDAVIDQQTGFLSAPGDINELKNYLQRLMEDKELREKMGSEGRKWSQKHSWQKLVKELYQNY